MSNTSEIIFNSQSVEAQITATGIDLLPINQSITETIIGITGPVGADGTAGIAGIAGIDGSDGPQGDPGPGIPVGGTIGQLPVKQSPTDYDMAWSANFKLDPVTGWVGAGTDSPQTPLHAKGDQKCLLLENDHNGGGSKRYTISPGSPGSYDGQLIISEGDDINDASKHIVRLTSSGFGIPDGNSVRSDGSGALAFYKPYTGSKAELAFRGAYNTDGIFRISGSYHNGSFHGQEVMYLRATPSGPKIGIGKTNPSTTLDVNGPSRVGSYTVATLPSASGSKAGAMIYISDESGGAVMAFSDGSNWLRMSDRVVVS